MSKSNEQKLELPSSFDAMTRIGPFIKGLISWTSLDEEDQDRIMLATSEAVNNAILHGNKQDPDKKVYLRVSRNEQELTVHVRDEGHGFNPDEVPNPLKEENLLNKGGRGIYLMRQYADKVQFSRGGTQATLIFYLKESFKKP